MSTPVMPLGIFLRELEARLRQAAPETLPARLMARAQHLAPEHRVALLSLFETPPRAALDDLSTRIADFVRSTQAGLYASAYDSQNDILLPVNGATWAERMDDLLAESDALFQEGFSAEAAEAFVLLFSLLETNEDLPGERPPESYVDTSLSLAKCSYLRALYETTPLSLRVTRLLQEMLRLSSLGDWRITLQSLREARPSPLPDWETFLPLWQQALASPEGESEQHAYPRDALRQLLRREAAWLQSGSTGLAALADAEGNWHPEVFFDLVDALSSERKFEEARAAAERGFAAIEEDHAIAQLAEKLAGLEEAAGFLEKARKARKRAFASAPSLARLAALLRATGNTPLHWKEEALRLSQKKRHLPSHIAACLELLTTRIEDAIVRLQNAPTFGWRDADHPGRYLLPSLLYALDSSPRPLLDTLWKQIDTPSTLDPSQNIITLLQEALLLLRPNAVQQQQLRESLSTIVLARYRAIALQQYRSAYPRVVLALVATAETLALTGHLDHAQRLLSQADTDGNKSLQRELDLCRAHTKLSSTTEANIST